MKKYSGIRETEAGTYELNCRPFKGAKREFTRIQAGSKQEASIKRAEWITSLIKAKEPATEQRANGSFAEAWASLERNMEGDKLPYRTKHKFGMVFNRLFIDFRAKRFIHITTPAQLSLPFFEEYKGYYSTDLGRPEGVRTEMTFVKAIVRRLRKLGYCSEQVVKSLELVRIPKPTKKHYPEITDTKMKEFFTRIKVERPDFYDAAFFMLKTGRRIEETTLIERKDVVWSGINPIKINIRAEITKTDTAAPLTYLDEELTSLIRGAYQKSSKYKAPYLFLAQSQRYHGVAAAKIRQWSIQQFLGNLSEEVLGVRITPHYFRHRFCTKAGMNNLPLVDAMAISGIRDVKILTQYYSHSTTTGQAKVLETMKLT